MSKPTDNNCVVIVENGEFSIRLARVGKGPLVLVWVHEHGNGGRGIILDIDNSDVVISAWQDLLDEIEEEVVAGII